MGVRFRIRTAAGQELSFASHEMFAEFVRSGDLSPDDVVYDGETKEWASALTHPVVLEIRVSAEEVGGGSGDAAEVDLAVHGPGNASDVDVHVGPSGPEGDSGAAQAPSLDIGLDLAPMPQGLTPEEEAAAFVAKLEAERASQIDAHQGFGTLGFRMERGSTNVLEVPPPPPSDPIGHGERLAEAHWEPEPLIPTRVHRPPEPQRKHRTVNTGAVWRYAPFVILFSVLAAAGVFFGPELVELGGRAGGGSDARGSAPPVPPPPISDREDAVRGRARELYLASTQAALRGLDEVPDVWLRGEYLSGPSDFPIVRTVWEEYLTTIRQVRVGDAERYRVAYARALEDARVVDSLRASRLASASADFNARGGARAAHFDRVEGLALAAIQGHDALVRAEGTIAYQPATGPAVSRDPVIEAVGRSVEAQVLLNQVLDLVLARLHGPGGPGQVANVREWVWTGLLDAVAN
jgi:hypothetical protein